MWVPPSIWTVPHLWSKQSGGVTMYCFSITQLMWLVAMSLGCFWDAIREPTSNMDISSGRCLCHSEPDSPIARQVVGDLCFLLHGDVFQTIISWSLSWAGRQDMCCPIHGSCCKSSEFRLQVICLPCPSDLSTHRKLDIHNLLVSHQIPSMQPLIPAIVNSPTVTNNPQAIWCLYMDLRWCEYTFLLVCSWYLYIKIPTSPLPMADVGCSSEYTSGLGSAPGNPSTGNTGAVSCGNTTQLLRDW